MSEEKIREMAGKWSVDIAIKNPNGDMGHMAEVIYKAMKEAMAMQCEEDSETCLDVWRNTPNKPNEWKQNEVSHGCLECSRFLKQKAKTLRGQDGLERFEDD